MLIQKEEFGLELYAAISTCSEAQHVLTMISIDVHKGKETSDLAKEYKRLKAKAMQLLEADSISQDDAAKLARKYPWLLG